MEIKELLTEITQTEEVRSLLSNLRSQIKEDKKAAETYVDAAFIGRLGDLLSHADAKTRKNAALLLGDLSDRVQALELAGQVTQALWAAYEREDTKFVLASYIKGLSAYDCGEILESLQAERKRLGAEEIWEEDKKHMRLLLEQMDLLLEAYQEKENYRYQGIHKKHALILTTDPYMREALLAQVQDLGYADARMVGRGVRLLTDSLDKLSQIRIYREMLFVIRFRGQTLAAEENLAQAIVLSELLPLLEEVYGKKKKYPFALRMQMDADSKTTKRLAYAIEEGSQGRLANRPKDAVIELLPRQKKDGTYVVYARVLGQADRRFIYREHALPTSMAPVVAAEMVELVRPYLKEEAHVIDPFCGLGTLLIERMQAGRTRDVYGIDSFGEAIFYGRQDAKKAKKNIYFINRDYFDFTSSYLMEEVITEFPRMEHKEREEVDQFYRRFFDKTGEITADQAMVFALSTEEGILKKQLRLHEEFQLVRQIPMRGREQIYILKKRG